MPTSVKLILRTQKARADGACPVWLRVTANRKSRFTATGVSVEPRHWNDAKGQVRKSHPLADSLNAHLSDRIAEAQTAALGAKTADAVLRKIKGASGSFSAFFRAFIDDLDKRGQFWEWKKYRVTLGKLEECLGTEIPFAALDRAAVVAFERHLRKKHGNGPNTVLKELQRFRRVVRQAVRDGALKPGDDPFLVYASPKAERVERRKLSIEELGKLADLALDSEPGLARVRDAFLFAFYGGGVRFADVAALRPGDVRGGRLEYRMLKTGTLVSLPLPPVALGIAERYAEREGAAFLFPFLQEGEDTDPIHLRRRIASHNARANKTLKTLAKRAKLARPESVSFHVARHSYADFARTRSGDLFAISKALGHGSLQITQTYLKSFDREAVDRLTEQLWT